MARNSQIEWCDDTWNPVRGCTRISPGCGGANHEGGCYAEKIAGRFSSPGQPYHGYAERTRTGARWTGKLGLIDKMVYAPLRWRKPRRIFVNSMSDLFHENLLDADIDVVFAVMALAFRHTFQVLTKRADRMSRYLNDPLTPQRILIELKAIGEGDLEVMGDWLLDMPRTSGVNPYQEVVTAIRGGGKRVAEQPATALLNWPLMNVWLGVSVEDQERADERIPHLLATPAAVRFLSCEPLLGPLELDCVPWPAGVRPVDDVSDGFDPLRFDARNTPNGPGRIDWVIVGGESGGKPRALWVPHVRLIVDKCKKANVPVFVKQMGSNVQDRDDTGFEGNDDSEWPDDSSRRMEENPNGYVDQGQGAPIRLRLHDRAGGDPSEWPPDLRIREFPHD